MYSWFVLGRAEALMLRRVQRKMVEICISVEVPRVIIEYGEVCLEFSGKW